MKLLIISGTPKNDGITHSFVKVAVDTAIELGVEVEMVKLSSLNLTKCMMCDDGWGICFNQHRCLYGDTDGFNELQTKVDNADAFVYVSPVYWGEISEDFKIFLDKLRRCQATKQWNSDEKEVSFMIGKPSIMVAVAGGGGGGIVSTFADIERALTHMGGDAWPRERAGVFDYIAVNRWNQAYKRDTMKAAVTAMVSFLTRPKAVKVMPQTDYQLLITFDNGNEQLFDVKPYLAQDPFAELKDVVLFNKARISGTKVEWRPRLDIDVNELCYSD
ncbi:MAG: NAD(P)H-dependent oxidoreductase [Lachnospiraceae bacterium]|jgi:multimeric flavodoxin WrbA|nr:NAD(P)H-dependent oxidoreductase [Lachnospiraceae bacterium]